MILSEEVLDDINVFRLHKFRGVQLELFVLVLFELLPEAVLFDLGFLGESSQEVYFLELLLYQSLLVFRLPDFSFLLKLSLLLLSLLFLCHLGKLFS